MFKKQRKVLKAFQTLFYDQTHTLKPEAEIVLAFLRAEAGASGELGANGQPYFYDAMNRFDPNAALFAMGKRRLFDVMAAYLALNEQKVLELSEH